MPWNFSWVFLLLPFHGSISSNKTSPFFPWRAWNSSSSTFPFWWPNKNSPRIFGATFYNQSPHLCWWNQPNLRQKYVLKKNTFNQQTLRTRMVNMCVCVWKQLAVWRWSYVYLSPATREVRHFLPLVNKSTMVNGPAPKKNRVFLRSH